MVEGVKAHRGASLSIGGTVTAFGDWFRDLALPLWIDAGWDATTRTFHEHLSFEGKPVTNIPRRTLVQCRQIYVMAVAGRRGWHPRASGRAVEASASLFERFRSPDGRGFIFSSNAAGEIVDARRDLYTHAFVLLACAAVAALTGDHIALDRADAILRFLDHDMATPHTGGYRESLPERVEPRRQNSHMHLFEALLALHEVDATRGYLQRAGALRDLLVTRWLSSDGALIEHFQPDWTPHGAPHFPFEPGHHFEWAWLLTRYAAACGLTTDPVAHDLCSCAKTYGLSDSFDVYDLASTDGQEMDRATRLWPHTEAARAATLDLAPSSFDMTRMFLSRAMRRFLMPDRGLWIDRFDSAGRSLSKTVPARAFSSYIGSYPACSK